MGDSTGRYANQCKKQAAAVTLGGGMAALIFAMTKVGALMWIDTHGRTA
jgi:hypothetical protein